MNLLGWLKNWRIGAWDTAGGDDEVPLFSRDSEAVYPAIKDGLWRLAHYAPAHSGRIGSAITPRTAVVHTTDMMPDTFDALIRAWKSKKSTGACAHFLIGRSESQGVVQFCPITRNGNHAGGSNGHGWYVTPKGVRIHPNTQAVGIELHGAGHLHWNGKNWFHKGSGKVVPTADVFLYKNKGYHVITAYQFRMLDALLTDLKLPGLPGYTLMSNQTYKANGVAGWAETKQTTVVGHVTLDPLNKTDPGPQVMDWLNKFMETYAV